MKSLSLLALVASSSAFIIPDQQLLSRLAVDSHAADVVNFVEEKVVDAVESSHNALDRALSSASETVNQAASSIHAYVDGWLGSEAGLSDIFGGGEHPPHHHPHHGHKPNETIYQLISKSKYTTKLAKLIDEDEELVKVLNGTAANFTLFAPIDHAFEKIPDDAPEPSKEMIKKLLTYHVSPEFYPARRVLGAHTIPTLLKESKLGKEPKPQRLSFQIGLKGLTVNFFSRIVAVDIFATNGVIHGVDSLIIPPPEILDIIQFLPSEFSTLELGLTKTGLLETLNKTAHAGATFFAPSNFAFAKLGPKVNGFLFSKYGQKYLKALLQYHVVLNQTLYSTAYYKDDSEGKDHHDHDDHGIYHVDLPTLLDGKVLGVDIVEVGPFVAVKINGFVRVTVLDGIAKDGVIHVISDVLVPPKKLGETQESGELEVEDLVERLDPYLDGSYTEL